MTWADIVAQLMGAVVAMSVVIILAGIWAGGGDFS
jgi:low affinity Fe/Cu permease